MSNTPNVADHADPNDVVDTATAGTVEPKVKAATVASASSAAVVVPFASWLLSTYVFHGAVPLPVQGFVGLVIAGGLTFTAGWRARHVDRAPSGS